MIRNKQRNKELIRKRRLRMKGEGKCGGWEGRNAHEGRHLQQRDSEVIKRGNETHETRT
jgi:hypothetical protein